MKSLLKVLFIVFVAWIGVGVFLLNTEHEKAQIVMGLAVLFFSFIFMPLFIYHRYRKGKYKKYVLNDRTLLGKMKEMNDK
jgi:predicted tellurium resistance membrane protein TerC